MINRLRYFYITFSQKVKHIYTVNELHYKLWKYNQALDKLYQEQRKSKLFQKNEKNVYNLENAIRELQTQKNRLQQLLLQYDEFEL